MEELKVADEKGLQDVHVFQLCECDAVAAHTLDEAIAWYKEQTGVDDGDLYVYEEIEVVSPEHKVYDSENRDEMITVREIIEQHWKGEPFVALSTEW